MSAICEPSGDKLQPKAAESICGCSARLPLRTSKRNVTNVFPLMVEYRQTVDGFRAHWTFTMRVSARTKRGVPPPMGTAKMDEGVSTPAFFGTEIYKISEPSGVNLGCQTQCSSGLVTKVSAKDRSMACLKISGVSFRFETNRTALLSGVQEYGRAMFSSMMSRLFSSKRVPLAASAPTETLVCELFLRKSNIF